MKRKQKSFNKQILTFKMDNILGMTVFMMQKSHTKYIFIWNM
jgi:hypothetical protein